MERRCTDPTSLSLATRSGGSASDISFDDFMTPWVIRWVPIGSFVPEQCSKIGGNLELKPHR